MVRDQAAPHEQVSPWWLQIHGLLRSFHGRDWLAAVRILARLLRPEAPPRTQAGPPGWQPALGVCSGCGEQSAAHAGGAVSWFRRGGRSARTGATEGAHAAAQFGCPTTAEAGPDAGSGAGAGPAPEAGATRARSQGSAAGSEAGSGLGSEAGRGGSAVLQRDLACVLASNGALRARVLDRLFVMLNWALTELAAVSRVRLVCMTFFFDEVTVHHAEMGAGRAGCRVAGAPDLHGMASLSSCAQRKCAWRHNRCLVQPCLLVAGLLIFFPFTRVCKRHQASEASCFTQQYKAQSLLVSRARQALAARPQELAGGEAQRSTERSAGALAARAADMAALATALARLLLFAAARLPAAFLGAGAAAGVNLARLAETAAFVVMQARAARGGVLCTIG